MATSHDPDHLELLWQADAACVAEVRGVLVMLSLTSLRSEWLAPVRELIAARRSRLGTPAPTLGVYRLDRRFPIGLGFDSNLDELRQTWLVLRDDIAASAVVVEFGGMLGATMRGAVRSISRLTRTPSLASCTSVVEAARWLQPHIAPPPAGRFDPCVYVRAIDRMSELLGCAPSGVRD